ncbi:MAG: hypothetical protein ACPGYV_02945 [Phycisphaeraceae bacterium]
MAKRDQTPPYEIMRTRPGESSEEAVSETPRRRSTDPPAGVSRRAPWWVGSSAPLVLRLPRGMAVLAVGGLLLLIAVAYGVGTVRGAAGSQPASEPGGMGERTGPDGYFVSPEDDYDGPEVAVPVDPLVVERREPGLNYMQLITSTREDCERLATFFGARGVAIQLVPVHNKGLWVAYAVKRGYRADELDSESCKRYEQQLRALGRQWKASGKGADLSTMIFKRYDGPKPKTD